MLETVRGRLTLWYVCVLALLLVAFSLTFYFLAERALYARVDSGLRSLLEVSTRSLIHDTAEGQTSQSAAQSTTAEMSSPEQTLLIYDAAGKLLGNSQPDEEFRVPLPNLLSIPPSEIQLYTAAEEDDPERTYRLAVRRVNIPPTNIPYILVASQSLKVVQEELRALHRPLLVAGPLALLLASVGGWFLARKSLAPVVALAGSARRISAENLGQQLPVANPRDELGELAITFNELLARLDAAFAQQRQFMADASHELRTPLSVAHTAARVTLRKPRRTEAEYRETIQVMDEEIQRLTRIVRDMFLLARADTGRYPLQKQPLYLNDLVEEVARAGKLLAAEKAITLAVTNLAEARFYGDEDLLRRLLLNLVDNAIQHTPETGQVQLHLQQEAQTYVVTVSDSGAGVPAEAQHRIFERFYRADQARPRTSTADGRGAGLGLSIAHWIAEAHGGNLTLAPSDQTGATFVIRLPLPAEG